MIRLLSVLFIPNRTNYSDARVRTSYGILAGALGIALNLILAVSKWIAGALSGSIAILADAVNNLSDAGSSILSLVGFRLSAQRPDSKHPFGHGRIEYISGLFISVLILLMGYELTRSSLEKILHPTPVSSSILTVLVLLGSILVKLYMYAYNRSLGQKLDSTSMHATAMDSLSDVISTSLVLTATLIGKYTGLLLDGWLGILVGLFILFTGIKTMKDTVDPLLGQPPRQELVDSITDLVNEHSLVYGVHDLIVHDYGPGRLMISLHAEVPRDGDLTLIHDQIDHIERELAEKLHCSAVIHIDPIVTNDPETLRIQEEILQLVKKIQPDFCIHDFRIIPRESYTKILFDLSVPYSYPSSDESISEDLQIKISSLTSGRYHAAIQIDRI